MKIVIRKKVGESWTHTIRIEKESDWDALLLWLTPQQILQLKRDGHIEVDGYLYYVTSDQDTLEFDTFISEILK